METETTTASTTLDHLYKEYVRLSDRRDAILQSSWDDFKLLGAIGAFIVWPPLAQSDLFQSSETGLLLFIGFVGILFIVAILAMRDLIKVSIIEYYLQEIRIYEDEIRKRIDEDAKNAFRLVEHWMAYRKRRWFGVVARFNALFYLFLFFFPISVLAIQAFYIYAVSYGIVMLVGLGIHVSAMRVIYHE